MSRRVIPITYFVVWAVAVVAAVIHIRSDYDLDLTLGYINSRKKSIFLPVGSHSQYTVAVRRGAGAKKDSMRFCTIPL